MPRFFNPVSAPAAVGPYSAAAVLPNGFLMLSGQIALDSAAGNITGSTVQEQTEKVLDNIEKMLAECGFRKNDIVRAVIYTTDLKQFPDLNRVYGDFMGEHRPVRTTIEVSALPKGALVEIEITAWKKVS